MSDSSTTAVITAAITKYRTREQFIHWLHHLPKINIYELKKVLETVKDKNYVLWTANAGFRIFKK